MYRLTWAIVVAILAGVCGCQEPFEIEQAPAPERALRRAFDGAPPVIPHSPLGGGCASCHDETGLAASAPASPHVGMDFSGRVERCEQCHVYGSGEAGFVESTFVGLPQNLRRGKRLSSNSPPVIPHQIQMRENCWACHTGPAARAEIRTSHPERVRCRQCHVAAETTEVFSQ